MEDTPYNGGRDNHPHDPISNGSIPISIDFLIATLRPIVYIHVQMCQHGQIRWIVMTVLATFVSPNVF